MSDFNTPNEFVSGTLTDAAAMNTNFAAIKTFLNTTGVPVVQDNTVTEDGIATGAVTGPKLATVGVPGKLVTNGHAQSSVQYGPVAFGAGAVSASLLAITVTGDGATKMSIDAVLPLVGVTVAGAYQVELWDGAVGSGSMLRRINTYLSTSGGSLVLPPVEVAAFSGSKTFNIAISNNSGSSSTVTISHASLVLWTLDAYWKG